MTGSLSDLLTSLFKKKDEEELWPILTPSRQSEEIRRPAQHARKEDPERKHRGSINNKGHRNEFLNTASNTLPPADEVQFEKLSQSIYNMLGEPLHLQPNNQNCISYRDSGFRTKYR
ncbi:BA75_01367T0 [Komagataella pastoris]|uniref:BA75_01367T0 n=1 Tax=Komagataella pastoris TaxID=4922 RepID=A0A1B2J939_PICPA|nr:BA75_01367T0 [Komagataella pastoris]